MLEVGCGSGIYLHHAACANPQATGIGIDLQKDVIAETSKRLVEWGLAPRFRVMYADIRRLVAHIILVSASRKTWASQNADAQLGNMLARAAMGSFLDSPAHAQITAVLRKIGLRV
jgi:SAM-dependent methyltransferase